MYNFLIGPMLFLTIAIFIAGVFWRVKQYLSLTERSELPTADLPRVVISQVDGRERNEYLRIDSATDILTKWRLRLKRTMLGRKPIFSLITIAFHVLLIVLPLVTVGHNILMDEYLGFNLPTLSEGLVDNLTLLFLGLAGFFVVRRLTVPTVRSITTWRDWLALLVAVAPFATGWMTYHQVFPYTTMLYIHIICGELMLIAIPFTKLVHMPFFFFARFFIRNELTIGRGSRKWIESI